MFAARECRPAEQLGVRQLKPTIPVGTVCLNASVYKGIGRGHIKTGYLF